MVITADTPLCIAGEPSLPLRNALRDLERDWYKVFSRPLITLPPESDFRGDRLLLDLRDESAPEGDEAHALLRRGRTLLLTGRGERGQIFAVYAFCREVLGVDPLWYWNDLLPEKKAEITLDGAWKRVYPAPAFRYRGWFINDEDMLFGSYPCPTGDACLSAEGFNALLEALLRSGGNMMVPGSFAMPDEEVRRLCAARGVLINDHHVTPLGLNMYRWPEDVRFSYSRGKDRLREYWQTCIDTIKDYPQVWTVSFRGKNDHPYWQEDPFAPETDEGRAAEIGEAINTQIEMIRKADPKAVICFNMYNEQAKFYRQGLISLPEDVIRVWPGAGCFDPEARVRTGPGDGVYFHLSNAARNRVTQQISPRRIFASLQKYYDVGATSFCLFNVSNTRHLTMGIAAGMDYLWNAGAYARTTPQRAADRWLSRYLTKTFGAELLPEMSDLTRRFFRLRALNVLPKSLHRAPRANFGYQTGIFAQGDFPFLPDQKINAGMQGFCRVLIRAAAGRRFADYAGESEGWSAPRGLTADWRRDGREYARMCGLCLEDLEPLLRDAEALTPRIPPRAQAVYLTLYLTQIRVLYHGIRALRELAFAVASWPDRALAEQKTEAALAAFEESISALHAAEYGRWATWYETEWFSCHSFTRDLLCNVLHALRRESAAPIRYEGGYRRWLHFWDKLYAYQHDCNFPLLK